MKLSFLGIIVIALISFTSCQKGSDKIKENLTDDTELIYAIQQASNKINIELSDLPIESQYVLEQEYSESQVNRALMAPKLGYEVNIIQYKGSYKGEQYQTYFNLKGEKLYFDKGDKEDYGGDDKKRCFQLIYPVTYVVTDGTEFIINSKDDEDGWLELKAWYESHPDANKKLQLQYPVDIKWKDGTVVTINSQEEMMMAKKKCDNNDGNKRCFILVYPLTYLMPDDSEIILEVKEDRQLIKEWYEDHPDYQEKPQLQFPVEIKYKDGTIKTINSQEEMNMAKKDCGDDSDKRCFRIIPPMTYTVPDGTEITIEIKEDRILIKTWYEQHPDYDQKPQLQFPVDIKYKEGLVKTINSQEELKLAYADCK